MNQFFTLLLFSCFFPVVLFSQHETKLWSTHTEGGADENGAIFSYEPSTDTYTREYGFPSEMPGSSPNNNGFVDIGNDTLYTAITSGGAYGDGIIAGYIPSTDTYFRLADFNGDVTGLSPRSKMIYYNDKLYGTTYLGGANSDGTIYEFDPETNTLTKLVDFEAGTNGELNTGGLVLHNGKFYGTNYGGGSNGEGTIFEWNPITNNLVVLHHFENVTTSGYPTGTPLVYDDKIYGITSGVLDEGSIFEYDLTSSVFTTLHIMDGTTGSDPYAGLVEQDGMIYGTCTRGGSGSPGRGSIFKYDPVSETYSEEHGFTNTTGDEPRSDLTYYNNKFYGVTSTGGLNDKAVLFEWDPVSGVYNVLEDLDVLSVSNSNNLNSLCVYNGVIYGLTEVQSAILGGFIFKYDLAEDTLTRSDYLNTRLGGATPRGGLTELNGKLYGLTEEGGVHNLGVLYEFDPNTGNYSKKFDFNDTTSGSNTKNALSVYNDKLYGITTEGGPLGGGFIFEYDPGTDDFTVKKEIDPSLHGFSCHGDLVLYQDKFYALMKETPGSSSGAILEWDPITNVLTKKQEFSTLNSGRFPYGNLIIQDDWMFATTSYGGNNYTEGVIFRFEPNANIKATMFHFDGVNTGGGSQSSLTIVGNNLWGITAEGGDHDAGTIYKYERASSTFIKKYDLDGSNDGSLSRSTMTLLDGKLFGLCTRNGGFTTPGTLFSYDTLSETFTKLRTFNMEDGRNPEGDFLTNVSNTSPVLTNLPSSQNHCVVTSNSVTFDYDDADGDTPTFTVSSTNTALIENSDISVTQDAGNTYSVDYTPQNGQTGTTTIEVEIDDGYGSIQTISFDVFIDFPVINLGPDIEQCEGDVLLDADNTGATFDWNTGSTTQSITVTSSGEYSVEVTDANGCVNKDTVEVTINNLPSVNLGSDITQCGDVVTLNPQNSGETYLWSTGETTETIAVSSSGDYSVSVTDGNACSNSDTVSITINPLPNVDLGGTIDSCELSLVLDASNIGSSYLWNDNTTNQTITVTSSGEYFVEVTNSYGCIDRDTVQVNLYTPPNVDFNIPAMYENICFGEPIFSLSGGSPSGGVYSGTGVVSNTDFSSSSAGVGSHDVSYTYTNANGCTVSEIQVIEVLANPNVVASGTNVICEGEEATITASGASTYVWDNGAGNSSQTTVSPTSTTTYTVTGTDNFGCHGTDQTTITVNENPDVTVSVLGATLSSNYANNGVTYQWIDCDNNNLLIAGETNQHFTTTSNGSYAVIVSENNCTDTSICYTIDEVSIDDFKSSRVNIHPNPTPSEVIIDLGSSFEGNTSIILQNPEGQIIYKTRMTSSQKTLDLSELSTGLYFVIIRNKEQYILKKVVKK